MRSITYVSTAKKLLSANDLRALLSRCLEANRRHDITGMLLYESGGFIQVIEGPSDPIEQLYKNIRRDEMHSGVVTLLDDEIPERFFPEWSMGFIDQQAAAAELDGFTNFLRASHLAESFRMSNSNAKKMLSIFHDAGLPIRL